MKTLNRLVTAAGLVLVLVLPSTAGAEGAVRHLFNLNTVTDELKAIVPGQLYMRFWHGRDISVGVFRMVRNEQGHFPGKINRHGEEVALATEGRLQMEIDGKTYFFGEGEVMIIPPQMPHTGTCLSDACTLVSWFTPGRLDEWGPEGNDDPELKFLDRSTQ